MIQKVIRSETENNIDTLPIKKCNIVSDKKETFLFIYKKDHSVYISSDADIQSLDLSWKKPEQPVKITMHKRNFEGSEDKNNQLNENCCWEWLKKNLDQDIIKPYCPQSDPEVIKIEEDTPGVKTEENNRTNTSKNDKKYDSRVDITKLAIRMKQEGYMLSFIASTFRMNASTIKSWMDYYENSNSVPSLKTGRHSKLDQIHRDFIAQLLDNKDKSKNSKSIREIKSSLENKFNVKLHPNTVRRTIKSLGYTRKLAKKKKKTRTILMDRNSERVINLRKKIVMQMISKWSCKKIPIFIDETGFQNSMTPAYSYTKNGESLCQNSGVVKNETITVILAITSDTLIGYQCFKSQITTYDFHAFLSEFLKNNQDIYDHLNDYVFVMDNSPFHKYSDHLQFREFLPIIYLPPYSPFLNPIEEVFGQWKRIFREKPCKGLKEMLNSIHSSFKEINYSLIPKVYSRSLSFYPKCLKCLPIVF